MAIILTKTQELRAHGKTLEALEKLVTAPESQDLINNIQLGYIQLDNGHNLLYLTITGLLEKNLERKIFVKPSIKLVKKYNLTEEALVDLLTRLKA